MIPGLLLSGAVAVAAIQLGLDWFATHGLNALTVAIVLGMVIGNTVYPRIAERAGAGINFSKQTLLRAGVVLYGLRLTLSDVGQVGLAGVLIDALMLSSTLLLAIVLGTRLLKLDRDTAILIGAGSAICGAAAVMATEPVLRAKPERVTVAVATVVVFGTLAIFLYPVLYSMNQQLGIVPAGEWFFGIYAGSTIHEVAQVVAATRSIGPDASNAAVIAKMVRVMMLAPFLIGLSAWLSRRAGATPAHGNAQVGDALVRARLRRDGRFPLLSPASRISSCMGHADRHLPAGHGHGSPGLRRLRHPQRGRPPWSWPPLLCTWLVVGGL
jgi:uncharacterized integral membrane protein (TIGR00698 family)